MVSVTGSVIAPNITGYKVTVMIVVMERVNWLQIFTVNITDKTANSTVFNSLEFHEEKVMIGVFPVAFTNINLTT